MTNRTFKAGESRVYTCLLRIEDYEPVDQVSEFGGRGLCRNAPGKNEIGIPRSSVTSLPARQLWGVGGEATINKVYGSRIGRTRS